MEHDNKTVDSEGFLLVNDYWRRWRFAFKELSSAYFTGKVKMPDGTKRWYRDGLYHREDGPAVEWADGTKHWYYDGKEGLENFPPDIKKKLARRFLIVS